jgi:hypothetical protein
MGRCSKVALTLAAMERDPAREIPSPFRLLRQINPLNMLD